MHVHTCAYDIKQGGERGSGEAVKGFRVQGSGFREKRYKFSSVSLENKLEQLAHCALSSLKPTKVLSIQYEREI